VYILYTAHVAQVGFGCGKTNEIATPLKGIVRSPLYRPQDTSNVVFIKDVWTRAILASTVANSPLTRYFPDEDLTPN